MVLTSISLNAQYFNVNGNASDNGGGCYELTPFAKQQTGSVWSPQKISLLNSFEVSGKLYFGANAWTGADGIAFALQPLFNTATGTGAGLGVGYIAPSLVAEFDTYKNGYDPGYDHVAIVKDGNPDHNSGFTLSPPVQIKNGRNNVKNNAWYDFKITWDAASQTISIFIDCELRISYSGNVINDIFGGDPNVYWGFSAATGDKFNRHQVCIDASSLLKIEDTKICKGEIATISLPTTGTNYSLNSFTPTAGIVDASAPNPKFSPTQTTEYIVTYEGECNSEIKDTFIVEIDDAPTVDLGPDTNSCDPSSIVLDAKNTGNTYLWNTSATSQTITTSGAGDYHVKVTNVTGCSGYDTISVGLNNSLLVNIGKDSSFCGSFNYTLDAQNSGANYLWNDGSTTQTLNATSPGTYSVIVTAPSGCVGKDTVTIGTSSGPSVMLGSNFALCVGSDSTITANTSATNVLWSTGATSKTITVRSGINYTISAWNDVACISRDTLSILSSCCNDSIITDDTLSLCLGDSLDIIAKDGKNLTWNSSETWREINNKQIRISPLNSGYFYVQSTNKGSNLITNGDFEGGNLGFTSGYIEDCNVSPMMRGGYCVGTNPQNHNIAWGGCVDHSSGNGNMLIVDGAVTPNVKAWCQTINTVNNTEYEFSAWVSSIIATSPAILQFSINGTLLGNSFTAPNTACTWENFAAQWNSGTTTSAEICLINQSTAPDGNDFALDDIAFVPICEEKDSVYVVVGTQLLVDLGPDTTLCGDSLNLDVSNTGNGLNYMWNTTETTTKITVKTSGIYGVNISVPISTCKGSDSILVTFSNPEKITLPNDTVLCKIDSLNLDANPSNLNNYSYQWNSGETTPQITTKIDGQYIVVATNNSNCIITDTINVKFRTLPSVDLGKDSSFCGTLSINLDAQNSGSNYLWNTGTTSQTITASTPGVYHVDVTSIDGCTNSDTIELTLNQNPVVDLGSDNSFCGNFTLLADAGNNFNNYLWNTGATSSSINITTPGKFYVDVIDANGCKGVDTLNISQSTGTTVGLGPDENICAGENIILDAGNHGVNYIWNTGATTSKITVYQAGVYHVVVTNKSNCESKDTIVIGINPNPTVYLPSDTTFCQGETYIASTGNNTDNHSWSNGENNLTTPISNSTQLSVTVTNAFNCKTVETVNVIFENIQIDLNSEFYTCSGASLTLAPNSTQTGVNYTWNGVSNGSSFTTSAEGTHTLSASKGKCSASANTELISVNVPTLNFSTDTIACEGSTIEIEAFSTGTISWNDGSTGNSKSVYQTQTNYATASITNNGTTCFKTDSIQTTFYSFPEKGQIANFKNCFNEQPLLSIYPNTKASYYTWLDGNRQYTNATYPSFIVNKEGSYTVETYNHPFCVTSEEVIVEEICPIYIFTPNAFTPNGDGLNDEFKPVVSNSLSYELTIMNRWGEVIFTSTNPDQGWNGIMNGNLVQTEVYIYKLVVTGYNSNLFEEQYVKTGTVTLIR